MTDAAVTGGVDGSGPVDMLILYPSGAHDAKALESRPYFRYFEERGLADLAVLRDPRARVALLTGEPVDPWIVDRTLADFSDNDDRLLGDMRRRLTCVVPRRSVEGSVADAARADNRVMTFLRDEIRRSRSALLVNFAPSYAADELARELGIPVEEGPVGNANRWGTKVGSKTLFQEAGVPCARGSSQLFRSVAATTEAARRMALADPACERVVVKLSASRWVLGVGNLVVRSSTLLRTGDLQASVEKMSQPWETYCREIIDGGAIVEEHLDGATCLPSAQAIIGRDGALNVLATHEQLPVVGNYPGVSFPLTGSVATEVEEAMARIGAALAQQGVRGSFGVDFIVAGGCTYASEINLRKLGHSHVIKAVRAAVAGRADMDDRWASILSLPVAYLHRSLYDSDLFAGLTPQACLEALRRAGLVYDSAASTGILLHVMGALQPIGYLQITSIGPTPASASALDERAEAVLSAAARCELDKDACKARS